MSGPPRTPEVISLDSGSEVDVDEAVGESDSRPIVPASEETTFSEEQCLRTVLEVFPDVSHEHVRKCMTARLATGTVAGPPNQTIPHLIIEDLLATTSYPTERDRIKILKRKRDSPEVEAAKWKYKALRNSPVQYATLAKLALNAHFNSVPTKYISDIFKAHPNYYEAFFVVEKADRENDGSPAAPFVRIKIRRPPGMSLSRTMQMYENAGHDLEDLKQEMREAEQRWQKEQENRRIAQVAADAKQAMEEEHRQKGEIMSCACCFDDDVPLSSITHCNGEESHFFCFECARRNAENEIGSNRSRMLCMDGSRCEATFDREQRSRFLDASSIEKLDRIQQQEDLRLADVENLERCPFCDYAAICPPAEENKEFQCQNPDCSEVSCRLCNQKTHLPLSCLESKKEKGISQRREIEEARTEALLRTCNKCKIRILKEDGCNKVICTQCTAVMCDYCGQDISKTRYAHFEDMAQSEASPKNVKCPLYDQSTKRRELQVEKAGEEATAKVRRENPDLSEEDLQIKFAKGLESQVSPNPPHEPNGRLHGMRQHLGQFEELRRQMLNQHDDARNEHRIFQRVARQRAELVAARQAAAEARLANLQNRELGLVGDPARRLWLPEMPAPGIDHQYGMGLFHQDPLHPAVPIPDRHHAGGLPPRPIDGNMYWAPNPAAGPPLIPGHGQNFMHRRVPLMPEQARQLNGGIDFVDPMQAGPIQAAAPYLYHAPGAIPELGEGPLGDPAPAQNPAQGIITFPYPGTNRDPAHGTRPNLQGPRWEDFDLPPVPNPYRGRTGGQGVNLPPTGPGNHNCYGDNFPVMQDPPMEMQARLADFGLPIRPNPHDAVGYNDARSDRATVADNLDIGDNANMGGFLVNGPGHAMQRAELIHVPPRVHGRWPEAPTR